MSRPKKAGPPDEPFVEVVVVEWVWKPAHWVSGYSGVGYKARGRWVQRESIIAAYSIDNYMKMVEARE